MFAGLAVACIDAADRYYVRVLLGLDAAGVYAAGYRLAMAMALAAAAFRFAWTPFMLTVSSHPDAPRTYARVCTWYLAAGAWVCLGTACLLPPLVTQDFVGVTLFGPAYRESIRIVPLVAAGLNAILNFWWIPRWRLHGAAAATGAAYLVLCGGTWLYSQRLYRVPYQYGRLAVILLAATGLFAGVQRMPAAWGLPAALVALVAYPFLLHALSAVRWAEL